MNMHKNARLTPHGRERRAPLMVNRQPRQAAARAVDWRWVKGHAGHPENERADALAREGMAGIRRDG